MTGTNHIAGGLAFTGIFCSIADLNIFEKPIYLGFTVFFALLPDIDHTKSLIGKLFYPLAKYLGRRFGHRTITHSLLFFVVFGLFVRFLEVLFPQLVNITVIYTFAFGSHLLFDMMTKQGVPLFYPFYRNPCVSPANPDFRISGRDFATEGIFFVCFCGILLFCQPLFARGFWTTYNRSFGTLKHLAQEFKKSENLLLCEYSYSKNGEKRTGKGFVVNATENEALIFDKNLFVITSNEKFIDLKPEKTEKPYKVEEIHFSNISPDSLKNLIKNRVLLAFSVHSNTHIKSVKEKKVVITENLTLEAVFNPNLQFLGDSSTEQVKKRLELHHADLSDEKSSLNRTETAILYLKTLQESLSNEYLQAETYRKELIFDSLKFLGQEIRKLEDQKVDFVPKTRKKVEISHLNQELQQKKVILASGYLIFLKI